MARKRRGEDVPVARASGGRRVHGGVLHAGITEQLEPRTHDGITSRSLSHQPGTSTHGGIATGGRCGGYPPAQGRAGTARPSQRQRSVARGQWSVVSGQWSVVSGQWSKVSGRRSVVEGQWSVVSGRRSVVSGQWSVTAGGGYDLVAARGMGACTPILGGIPGPAIRCQQSVERVMPSFCSAWACLKRASAILVIRSVSAYKVKYILRSPP